MTRSEALKAMVDGNKVTHKYFTNDEYCHIVNNSIKTEDGYLFENEFLNRSFFDDGWRIYKG